jgi:hypothetical protein
VDRRVDMESHRYSFSFCYDVWAWWMLLSWEFSFV